MSIWKRGLFVLSLLTLLLGMFWIPFETSLGERLSVLKNGWGDRTYLFAGVGENGLFCAASLDGADRVLSAEKQPNSMELRFLNRQGDVLSDWAATLPVAAIEGNLCALYPVDSSTAFLAFKQEDQDGVQSLCVYRAVKDKPATAVLNVQGSGESQAERSASVEISNFSRNLDKVFFCIIRPDRVTAFSCPVSEGEVKRQEEIVRGDVLSAAVLSGGGLVLSGDGFLIVPGRLNTGVSSGQLFSLITCGSAGIYFVECHTMTAWYSDLTGSSIQQIFSLDALTSEYHISSLAMTPEGNALALLNGHILRLITTSGMKDLTESLYPGRGNSLMAVVFWLASSLFMTILIWQILSIVSQNRIPLALYWGTVTAAILLGMGLTAWYRILIPAGEQAAIERRTELLGAAAGVAMRELSVGPEEATPRTGMGPTDGPADYRANSPVTIDAGAAAALSKRLETALSGSGAKDVHGLQAVLAERSGQAWILSNGIRGELDIGFHPVLADRAEREGFAAAQDGERFWYCRTRGGQVLCVSAVFGRGLEAILFSSIQRIALIWCVTAASLLILILLLINLDVRRLASAMERYSSDAPWKRLRLHSGDELEGMATSLNALADNREEEDERRNALVESYRRFVPEPVIGLLGKRSILEVDKESFAMRDMAVMAVSFTFPESVYRNRESTKLLFKSVNQVIEQTASIAARKGGTVFNFNFDGYDVVFGDMRSAVSAAVAIGQETLSLNNTRSVDGLPAVTLRTALDFGGMVVGIIGDGEHLEQTTISSRFNTVRTLIRLCGKLEAGILCTESAMSAAESYSNRYVGRCRVDDEIIRVYEIFDADPYGTRTEKASTLRQFTHGVLSLYSGELAQAKRVFLELAHETPSDGAARYYLFLADQMEQRPDLPCELDSDV